MPLNKCEGNMYADMDFCHNIIRGKCPFGCIYCYMKRPRMARIEAYHKSFHIVESEIKVAYPSGTRIFIGSATDMWMAPEDQIARVLARCREVNSVLSTPGLQVHWVFQSKDPGQMIQWIPLLPICSTLITTIETNLEAGYENISQAPVPTLRASRVHGLGQMLKRERPSSNIDISVTMEPIMEFDTGFISLMKIIKPKYISIGAATLKEYEKYEMLMPHWKDVAQLVSILNRQQIEVRIKKNLLRLAPAKKEKTEFRDWLSRSGAWLTWEWLHIDGAMNRYEAWKLTNLFEEADDIHRGFTDMIIKPEPFMKFTNGGEK